MELCINRNTTITTTIRIKSVRKAVENLKRDLCKSCLETKLPGAEICLVEYEQEKECYQLIAFNNRLEIRAKDEFGFIYGIYEVSRRILGIHEFWFWNDQKIIPQNEFRLPEDYFYQSTPFKVKYRGWFVNDEVLLNSWYVERKKSKPWEMLFEALLRLGGNMVIPGTDKNSNTYRDMASEMGFYVSHHHAEPLGAEMFARQYPNLNPSYDEHAEKFEKLWQDGIQMQKKMKVIWNLGFRGQGDCPFWDNDPRYQTDEARGALMSDIIQKQYDMVKQNDGNAICCTNLYGETMELYQKGFLKVPKDIIKIWADNGYGKMVTRRQNNHNPRIPSLPTKGEKGSHGIYYHVSFYDLQAANHITMLPNSIAFIKKELDKVIKCNASDFWIINCSNIKPHVYLLDYISKIWKCDSMDSEVFKNNYVTNYYGSKYQEEIIKCFDAYSKYALSYGNKEDEHAGEQFSNHVARTLASQFMKDRTKHAESLLWFRNTNNLIDQINSYKNMCINATDNYDKYLKMCELTVHSLDHNSEELFRDSLLLQARVHYYCFKGASLLCEGLLEAEKENYKQSFYLVGKAKKNYLQANHELRAREHGKWKNFYQNECLTDIKQTAWVLSGLMSYLRNMEDGPHFYQWQREFLYAPEDSKVMLILNMENHLTDDEIFSLMEERYD